MPQLDISTFLPQIFWLVITFTALFLIMWKIAVPGIANALEARQKRIQDNLNKATQAKQEAEETLAAYEATIHKARAEAQAIHARAAKALLEEADARENALSESLSSKISESEDDIRRAVEDAMGSVRKIATEVAGDALERLTGKPADENALTSAVNRALKADG